MLEFLAHYWDSILVILVFIGLIIFFAVKGKKKIVYQMLYALVTEAEKIYGSGTGSVKFAYVVEKVYSYMPAILKVFITYDALRDMIERALKEAKIAWGKEAGVEQYLAEEQPLADGEEETPADPISETLAPDDEIKITIRRYGEAFQIVGRAGQARRIP